MRFNTGAGASMRHFTFALFRIAATFACFAAAAGAVQLRTWRLPYCTMAAEMGLLTASPSGMFWDDLGPSPFSDASFFPDSPAFKRNHWIVEPAYSFSAMRPAPAPGRPLLWQLEVLSDIRYRGLTARQTLHADRRSSFSRPSRPVRAGPHRRGVPSLRLEARLYQVRKAPAQLGAVHRPQSHMFVQSVQLRRARMADPLVAVRVQASLCRVSAERPFCGLH
jgi:hypothetical protein